MLPGTLCRVAAVNVHPVSPSSTWSGCHSHQEPRAGGTGVSVALLVLVMAFLCWPLFTQVSRWGGHLLWAVGLCHVSHVCCSPVPWWGDGTVVAPQVCAVAGLPCGLCSVQVGTLQRWACGLAAVATAVVENQQKQEVSAGT